MTDEVRVCNSTVVIIPAFNEAETIAQVISRARRYVARIVVIDDGSEDHTAKVAARQGVALIRHDYNRGKAAALETGCRYALALGAAAVITIDGDAQHDPADIPGFLTAAARHPNDIILGARRAGLYSAPRHRYIANRIADFWVSWAAGYRLSDSQCGFRLYPRMLLQKLKPTATRTRGFVYESELLIEALRAGFKVTSIPIKALYFESGRASHFRANADIMHITTMIFWKLIGRGLYLPGLYHSLCRDK